MAFGIIENGRIINAVEAADAFAAEQGWVKLTGSAGIGWSYAGGKFTAPPAPAAPPETFGPISDRQFFQALAETPFAIITEEEALAAVSTGAVPEIMRAVVEGLPIEKRFGVRMILSGATTFERTNPLVEIFGASQNMDAAAIDAFWRFAETR